MWLMRWCNRSFAKLNARLPVMIRNLPIYIDEAWSLGCVWFNWKVLQKTFYTCLVGLKIQSTWKYFLFDCKIRLSDWRLWYYFNVQLYFIFYLNLNRSWFQFFGIRLWCEDKDISSLSIYVKYALMRINKKINPKSLFSSQVKEIGLELTTLSCRFNNLSWFSSLPLLYII